MDDESMRPDPAAPGDLERALSLCLLRPGLTDSELLEGCRQAAAAGLGSVTVFPCDAERALRALAGSGTQAAAVAGFPCGTSTTAAKLYEARDLLRRGVKEVLFVLNAGQLRSREFQQVETELMQIGRSCAESGARLHVVAEAALLGEDLRVIATKIAKRCDASVLSLSAWSAPPGDPRAGLEQLRRIARGEIELGLAGQELELDAVLEAWRHGAARFCCSNALEVAAEWKARREAQAESGHGAG